VPSVELSGLSKAFRGAEAAAVHALSLAIEPGEHLALVGPSGSGKTTVLRLVAGFLVPDAGRIRLGGRLVADARTFVPPERRGVGMVFQDYALFPHLSVRQNVAFGLVRLPAADRDRRLAETLSMVGLTRLAERHPHELSGGEQQRVALARAIAPRPIVILLDEPFSSLDAGLRQQVRSDVCGILRESGVSAVFVTHDQDEALDLGDRIAVMNAGRLEQCGRPETVFAAPASRFVAEFLGRTDFLPGQVTPEGILTEIGLLAQPVAHAPGTAVEVAFRPDDVQIQPDPGATAQVSERRYQGTVNLYAVRLSSGRLVHSLQPHTRRIAPGTAVRVLAEPGHALACFRVEAAEPAADLRGNQAGSTPGR
jgi:iron(III) transport system ATP-binding protein